MQLQTQNRQYTPEEYLQLEEQAEYKNEYHDGEIIPMTGGTTNHNEIAGNCYTNLKFGLRQQNYRVYIGDVRLWIPRHRVYTYPDVMVIKGKPIYADKGTTTVTNPILIAEVLSKSTQNYDQGDKFTYYRSIPEIEEYILIAQEQYHIMQYTKTEDKKWLLSEYEGEDLTIQLNAIAFELQLSDIYAGVDFNEPQ
ncbi:unknown [Crocosphaera subtropica ATCC 51142]|uniref:Putative restriction endonuclease domain-containing protein n=1 Tax=Crocosphaera subtropica (strain ATCC 51142 / BH68) TaxID=43989 RepID=B1WWV1_CROS5|nr:Uma2 family endonuclease [Crocosphaera subtropica]ACB52420.1 unknown [Crocosphaera subtropica ATCC 51142]